MIQTDCEAYEDDPDEQQPSCLVGPGEAEVEDVTGDNRNGQRNHENCNEDPENRFRYAKKDEPN